MIAITDRQTRLRIPRALLRRVVAAVLAGEKAGMRLSYVFVNGREMRRLNRRFLRHDFDTDVLAFPMEPDFGEVVISTDYAVAESAKRGIPVREELMRYAAHGLLHLLGYDDHRPADRRAMWRKQEAYLKAVLPDAS